jgi:hypothetical protein
MFLFAVIETQRYIFDPPMLSEFVQENPAMKAWRNVN